MNDAPIPEPQDAMRALDDALCQFLNCAKDDFEPIDEWREETWANIGALSKAYNDAHLAGCFPAHLPPFGKDRPNADRD